MEQRRFGNLGDVSSLTLGGGTTGQVWGSTTQEGLAASRMLIPSTWQALRIRPYNSTLYIPPAFSQSIHQCS